MKGIQGQNPALFQQGRAGVSTAFAFPVHGFSVEEAPNIPTNNGNVTGFGFSKSALALATRLPKFQAGDQCADRQIITDPNTGISFELSMWPGQRMVKYEVAIAYGMTVIKPEHLAVIIG